LTPPGIAEPAAPAPIGLIAGGGALPIAVVEEAHRRGRQVVCVDVFEADARLPQAADAYYAVNPGELSAILEALRRHGVREVLLAGKVDKLPALRRVRLDAFGEMASRGVRDHRDTSILTAFLGVLQISGFEVASQTRYLAHLIPDAGILTPRPPTQAEAADIETGLRIAVSIARLDIGQAVALRNGAVIAVEAAEGTDEMIRRAGRLAPHAVVVKVSRPEQDPRYDLPVVGPDTVHVLKEARATALAVEAGRTILIDRDQVIAAAAASEIAITAAVCPANF
jgi:DUF1009 family protein